jgi:hypothetical protein
MIFSTDRIRAQRRWMRSLPAAGGAPGQTALGAYFVSKTEIIDFHHSTDKTWSQPFWVQGCEVLANGVFFAPPLEFQTTKFVELFLATYFINIKRLRKLYSFRSLFYN